MRKKDYIIPLIALAVVIGYLVQLYFNRQQPITKMFDFKQFSFIAVSTDGKDIFSINKDSTGAWRLIKPISWKTKESSVKKIIEAIKGVVKLSDIGTFNEQSKEDFDKDIFSFSIVADNKSTKFKVATSNGKYYIISDNEIYMVNYTIKDAIIEDPTPIRENTILNYTVDTLDKFKVNIKPYRYTLEKKGKDWLINNIKIEPQDAKQILDDIVPFKGDGFAKDDTLTKKSKKVGSIQIVVGADTNNYLVYRDNEEYYIMLNGGVYRLDSDFMEMLKYFYKNAKKSKK